jgi:hypothetical protein
MKFCVNCKYFEPATAGMAVETYSKCTFRFAELNLVSGQPKAQKYMFCEALRKSEDDQVCGPQGRYFVDAVGAPTVFSVDAAPRLLAS